MKLGEGPVAIWAWPAAVLAVALLVLAADPGGFARHIRNIEFDAYQDARPRPYEDPRAKSGLSVRTLEVDPASVAKFGAWPWPRATLAKLTTELKDAGAALVVFAFPLDRADPASTRAVIDALPKGDDSDALRKALARLPSPDDALARAMAATHAVTGFLLRDAPGGRPPHEPSKVVVRDDGNALTGVPDFATAYGALEVFETASTGTGALNLGLDADGKFRALPFVYRLAGKPVAAVDAEAVRLANAANAITLRTQRGGVIPGTGHAEIVAGEAGMVDVPLGAEGSMLVYYGPADAPRGISAAALDDGKIGPGSLKDAIVYVVPPGEILDTPVGRRGVAEIRAEAMENILLGTALSRPNARGAELLFTLLGGALIVFLLLRNGLLFAGLAAAGLVLGAQVSTWAMFANGRVLIDSLGPSLAFLALYAAGMAASAREFARTRANLKHAFAEALPPSVLERIARRPALLKLDGETRTVTYLSCSVRDFARLASSFLDDPPGFTRLMRRVTGPLLDEVTRHGGTIDRVTSDGFSAFWNAPIEDPEHAIHACEAANGMTEALARVNEQIARERRIDGTAIEAIEIGIGISTGQAVAGGFGARQRAAYSVTGDPVVTAEKIRALSQQYGPAVILSEETRKEAARGFAFLEVDFIAAGPRDEPIKLYALLGNPLVRASPKFRAMTTFHDHIFQAIRSQQWGKARELIAQCRKLSGASQKLYDLHANRIEYFEDNPPGSDWDGAFRTVVK
jgi:adenylate cyclase